MIESIHVKNFKAFSDSKPISIKPITLFCGTNSCGKSSLLQSILLWKQSVESRNYDQSILMNGRLIHLGTFLNCIHNQNTEEPLIFDYTYAFTQNEFYRAQRGRHRYPLRILLRDFIPEVNKDDEKEALYKIEYAIELVSRTSKNQNFAARSVVPRKVSLKAYLTTKEGVKVPGVSVKVEQEGSVGEYRMTWQNLTLRHKRKDITKNGSASLKSMEFINLVPAGMTVDGDDPQYHEASFLFYRLGELLRHLYGTITYLGPLREEPARRYIYEDEVVEIGIKGENAAYIYMAEGSSAVRGHYFYNQEEDTFERVPSISLEDSVKRWFSVMGIHEFGASSESEIIRLAQDSSCGSSTRVNIADVGFGVSQILPIILEGLRMNIGQTLLLEQPEIHLHPRLQMQLADYIISLALTGKKVVLETHSDHIVNRLIRRMAEDSSGDLAEKMGIYFVHQTEKGSELEEVSVDNINGILNWPDEFFDQAAIEQQHIMKALIANRKEGC